MYQNYRQRLKDLEELLNILYKRLGAFQKEVVCESSFPVKMDLDRRIKQTRLDILKYEAEYEEILAKTEYEEILAKGVQEVFVVPDVEAKNAIVQVNQAVKHIENIPSERYPDPEELKRLLEKLHKILNDPGKTAQAKLKIALPIIPLIASYELEMDTEAFLVNVWQQIKSMVRRQA